MIRIKDTSQLLEFIKMTAPAGVTIWNVENRNTATHIKLVLLIGNQFIDN